MRHLLLIGLLLCSWIGCAQTIEEKVSAYLNTFLSDNKSFITEPALQGTVWSTSDAMGNCKIAFGTNLKFKIKSNGFQAGSSKSKGEWYIHNEFVVLVAKKDKTPLYVLSDGDVKVLVNYHQIDVLKELLTEASYKDGELKPYTYEEIFTFLNGFRQND